MLVKQKQKQTKKTGWIVRLKKLCLGVPYILEIFVLFFFPFFFLLSFLFKLFLAAFHLNSQTWAVFWRRNIYLLTIKAMECCHYHPYHHVIVNESAEGRREAGEAAALYSRCARYCTDEKSLDRRVR